MWIKQFQNTRLIKNTVIEDSTADTRTHKVFNAIESACYQFDLSIPIWLDKNVSEFKRFSKTRFYQDNFIEEIEFDFIEIHMLDEDDMY